MKNFEVTVALDLLFILKHRVRQLCALQSQKVILVLQNHRPFSFIFTLLILLTGKSEKKASQEITCLRDEF